MDVDPDVDAYNLQVPEVSAEFVTSNSQTVHVLDAKQRSAHDEISLTLDVDENAAMVEDAASKPTEREACLKTASLKA